MARTNGPIQVFHRGDTIPLDAEGGYAGGDSTAAAVGTALAQTGQALATVDNLQATATTLPPGSTPTATVTGPLGAKSINFGLPQQIAASSTPGLLDYALAIDDGPAPEPPPVTVLSDTFTGDGPISGRTPTTGPAWSAGADWATTGGRAVTAGTATASMVSDAGVSDDLDAVFDLRVTTAAPAATQTFWLFVAAQAPVGTGNLSNGLWVAATINTSGYLTGSLNKRVGGTYTSLGAITVTGVPSDSATPVAVRVTATVRDGLFTGTFTSPDGATVYGATTVPITTSDVSGTRVGVYAFTGSTQMQVDAITVTRPGDPAPPPATDGKIVTADEDGALPAVVLDALDARYAGAGGSVARSAFEALRTLHDFGSGTATVAVVSDSTANDRNDWTRIWALKYGAGMPSHVRRTYRDWDATNSVWRTELVDNPGASADSGVIVEDAFTRTGPVVGSTPDTGPTWAGSADGWTSDGDLATLTGGASKTLSNNLASSDQTIRATLALVSTGTTATQSLRVYAGSGASGLYTGLWAALGVSTTGNVTVALYTTFGASTVTLAGSTPVAGAVTNSATPQAVTIEVTTRIQQAKVSVTAAGQTTTLTGVIPEADVPTLGSHGGFVGAPAGVIDYGLPLTSVRMDTPAADNPTGTPTLAVHNAAIAGGSLATFDATKRAAMFGSLDVNVLIFAMGHNNGTQSPAAFTAEVAAWLTAWRSEHPGSAILISTQNPQVAPSTGIAAHRDRQAALRTWAKARGYDYIPTFEAFTAQPDGGAALVGTDGVHPTTPPVGTLTGTYGSVLWADTATNVLGQ